MMKRYIWFDSLVVPLSVGVSQECRLQLAPWLGAANITGFTVIESPPSFQVQVVQTQAKLVVLDIRPTIRVANPIITVEVTASDGRTLRRDLEFRVPQ